VKEEPTNHRLIVILDKDETRAAFDAMLEDAKRDRARMTRLGASNNIARIDGWIAGVLACRSVIARLAAQDEALPEPEQE